MEKEEIREAILKRYRTLKEFADHHGERDTQISKWLSKPSARFRAILKKEGILEDVEKNIKTNHFTRKEAVEQEDGMVISEREIENFVTVIKELKEIIYEKNSYIKDINNLLIAKDKVIDQLKDAIEINERVKE